MYPKSPFTFSIQHNKSSTHPMLRPSQIRWPLKSKKLWPAILQLAPDPTQIPLTCQLHHFYLITPTTVAWNPMPFFCTIFTFFTQHIHNKQRSHTHLHQICTSYVLLGNLPSFHLRDSHHLSYQPWAPHPHTYPHAHSIHNPHHFSSSTHHHSSLASKPPKKATMLSHHANTYPSSHAPPTMHHLHGTTPP